MTSLIGNPAKRPTPSSPLPPPPSSGGGTTFPEEGIFPPGDRDDDRLRMTPESSEANASSEDETELDDAVEMPIRPASDPGAIGNTPGAHSERMNVTSLRGAYHVSGPGIPPPPDEGESEARTGEGDAVPRSAVVGWVQYLAGNAPLVEGTAVADADTARGGGGGGRDPGPGGGVLRQWRSRRIFAALAVALVAAIAGGAAGLSARRRAADEAAADGSARFRELRRLAGAVSDEGALSDPASPQSAALSWMANEDELSVSLSPKGDAEAVIQRYIMAVLYFSTDGENWAVRNFKNDEEYRLETNLSETASWLCTGWGYACWEDFEGIEMERSGERPYLSKDIHECNWEGVGCHEGADIVGAISMVKNNLGGTFPQEIAALKLKYLHLTFSTSQMGGSLEPLRNLGGSIKEISLSYNNLTGTIPDIFDTLPNLTHFVCDMNRLTGSIPKTINGHNNLKRFSAGFNGVFGPGLSGTIPLDFNTMPSLENFFLAKNSLSGPIPPSIGNWVNHVTLGMSHNLLTGTIPESIGRLTRLKSLALSFNDLSGTIPSDLFDLQELYGLKLGNNALTGTVPKNLGNASWLQWLTLDNNGLTGTIPTSIGDLQNLFAFSAHNNHFNGTIPPAMGSITSMRYLQLRNNELVGTLPETFKDAINLEELHIAQNQLTGSMNFLCNLQIPIVYADCGGVDAEVDCECCKFCCSDEEELASCNDNAAWSILFGYEFCLRKGTGTFLCSGINPLSL